MKGSVENVSLNATEFQERDKRECPYSKELLIENKSNGADISKAILR